MEIKYPNLIKVQHSRRGMQKHTIVMVLMIIALSLLLCMSARAETKIINQFDTALGAITIADEPAAVQPWRYVEEGEAPPAAKNADNPYQNITISDEEFNELRWVVALESGKNFDDKKAVVEAIFNRVLMNKKDFGGGTVHGVLSKRGQFSTFKYIGSKKAWATPGEAEDDAISEVLRCGATVLPSYKYVYFDSKGGVNGKNHIKIKKGNTYGEG